MRARLVVWIGLIAVVCVAHTRTAMHYYDQTQAARDKTDSLVDPQHPDAAHLKQAQAILKHALDTLARPDVVELAEGNRSLLGRRYDTLRDLAGVYALEGRTNEALDALEAMQAEAWIPAVAPLLRKNPEFASLRGEPRFKALLITLDNTKRLWNAETLAVPYAPQLSEVERIAGLSLFWSEVKYNFVYFDHVPNLDWDRTYLEFLPQVIAAKNTRAYYEVLMRLAPLLHDGHTNIYPPKSIQNQFYASPSIRTALIQNKVIVTWVASPRVAAKGLRVGDEIMSIDGQEVHQYAKAHVEPYVSSSTPQDLAVRMYDYQLLSGDHTKPVSLGVESASGKLLTLTLSREPDPTAKGQPAFAFRMLPGGVAYLALGEFENDEGAKFFKQHLPQILKARGLILDVRNNGGGSTNNGLDVLTWLSSKPIPEPATSSLEYVPAYRAWGGPSETWKSFASPNDAYSKPHKQQYTGPVAVLVGPRIFSAAEDFVVSFKAMQRGILVGRTTAGSAGQPLGFKLPGGGTARICTLRETFPDGRKFVGKGIAPQIKVAPTVADIRSGYDAAIAAAAKALLADPTHAHN